MWVFFLVLCASCDGKNSDLKDGYYSAEAAEFDTYGWKEYITICISGGQLTYVEYNAFNSTGFIKSWDMEYMRQMNAVNHTYPNAYTRYYKNQLLSNKGTLGIDSLSGASESYNSFIRLADAAFENARLGNTETRLVNVKEGRYRAGQVNINESRYRAGQINDNESRYKARQTN